MCTSHVYFRFTLLIINDWDTKSQELWDLIPSVLSSKPEVSDALSSSSHTSSSNCFRLSVDVNIPSRFARLITLRTSISISTSVTTSVTTPGVIVVFVVVIVPVVPKHHHTTSGLKKMIYNHICNSSFSDVSLSHWVTHSSFFLHLKSWETEGRERSQCHGLKTIYWRTGTRIDTRDLKPTSISISILTCRRREAQQRAARRRSRARDRVFIAVISSSVTRRMS